MRSATQGHFPPTKDWYEDALNDKVHYLGWLMHEGDFRKGAGEASLCITAGSLLHACLLAATPYTQKEGSFRVSDI